MDPMRPVTEMLGALLGIYSV
ncbi:hypothetical protein MESS4_330172 [Mesorhizobium sp. STM 4661]|nr:hypothetical protein MESS4_330172 [Mesorhizobium sp. STM 4661]